jgi:hypothetical protein
MLLWNDAIHTPSPENEPTPDMTDVPFHTIPFSIHRRFTEEMESVIQSCCPDGMCEGMEV